jgi:hypothetical protein
MNVKRYLTIICFLITMCTSFVLLASDVLVNIPENSGELRFKNLPVSQSDRMSGYFSEGSRKEELLAFAKAVFLAHLGFAGAPVVPPFLKNAQHACFVTFFSGKKVISCFGGFYPRTGNIAREIDENVRLALHFDPRARSIDRKTAMLADVQITFPGNPEVIKSYTQVNPLREGLLVENERDGVAIVPGEAKTASWAFREAMRRLSEKDRTKVRLSKFRAYAVSSRNAE